ncbi:UNVERIFIED_CONTAM: hypothetical protein K2H54_065848, partial [Gekko kuhli]
SLDIHHGKLNCSEKRKRKKINSCCLSIIISESPKLSTSCMSCYQTQCNFLQVSLDHHQKQGCLKISRGRASLLLEDTTKLQGIAPLPGLGWVRQDPFPVYLMTQLEET